MAPARYWHELTSPQFEALDKERTVAVLPVGAIEQHGPHLPVYVDACLNQGLVSRALDFLTPDQSVLVLPMMPVGKSNEHLAFPGTLTLSAETLTRLWMEIGESVMRAGIRKLVIFNSHGGQPQIMNIVQRELRVRYGMMVVGLSWPAMGLPEGMFDANERKNGIHAGDVETSMMLHLRPDLVHMDKAQNFRTVMEELDGRFEKLTVLGGASIGWQVQDLNPNGAAGDATKATAEKGKAVVDHVARNFAKLLAEVADYPLELIRQR
jgi:creatinine amidohydrolase